MTERYRIGGIELQLSGNALPPREPLLNFLASDINSPRCKIDIVEKCPDVNPEYFYINGTIKWGKTAQGSDCLDCFGIGDDLCSRAVISRDMREVSIFIDINKVLPGHFMRPVLDGIFYSLCLFERGIVIHSAAIDWKGNGILFSAPSGTGKTTQAEMWINELGAEYVNGDRPLLRFYDKSLHVCGTPWSGSMDVYRSACVPVTAIVFIEQHSTNRMRRLSPAEALRYMLPRCFLPYHSSEYMALAMDNVNSMLDAAECWHLYCTPEIASMELVKECVMTSPKFRG